MCRWIEEGFAEIQITFLACCLLQPEGFQSTSRAIAESITQLLQCNVDNFSGINGFRWSKCYHGPVIISYDMSQLNKVWGSEHGDTSFFLSPWQTTTTTASDHFSPLHKIEIIINFFFQMVLKITALLERWQNETHTKREERNSKGRSSSSHLWDLCLLADLRTEQVGISHCLISPSERQKTTSHLKLK